MVPCFLDKRIITLTKEIDVSPMVVCLGPGQSTVQQLLKQLFFFCKRRQVVQFWATTTVKELKTKKSKTQK